MPVWSRIIIMLAAMLTFSCTPPSSAYYGESSPRTLLPDSLELTRAAEDALEIFDPPHLSLIEKQARNSAVKVIRPFEDGHGSGSYVKMHGRFIVITAAHVVGNYTTMIVEGRDDERVIGRVLYSDDKSDLALILVPRLESRLPAPYRPRKDGNINLVGSKVNYTGFPGRHDLLTIRGDVASFERDMIVINMFGWFGASGSGVFDSHGRFLGVVSGIDVGQWMFPIPLDNIVWVAPIWKLDDPIVEVRVKTAHDLELFKSFPGARSPRRGTARD